MSGVPGVTKFSYLKELLEPNVRTLIDGLPFSTEGYERAKTILKSDYGKKSEIVNAYVSKHHGLTDDNWNMPRGDTGVLREVSVQCPTLESLGKLREVNGYVRMSIDKLEGIIGDWVQTDDTSQDWDFPKLVD